MIGWIFAVIVALAGLAFWGFGAVDMYWTLTGNEDYLAAYPPEMIAWIQGFPIWRKALWGVAVAAGVLGSLLLFLRSRWAGHLMLLGLLVMISGFVGHDVLLANGLEMYGDTGLVISGIMMAIAAVLTILAYLLSRSGRSAA